MNRILMILIAVCLDLCFGDPYWLYHPVRLIGKGIAGLKRWLQIWCSREHGIHKRQEIIAGGILAVVIIAGAYGITAGILYGVSLIHPMAAVILEIFWMYQILAARCLKNESDKVYKDLKNRDLAKARISISYLVGRDTKSLSEEEVAKACVETVAENTTDGVIAPLFYLFLGGAPLGMAYKAVNTLDSMVGYRNEELEYLGKVSARLDDAANFLPARIGAVTMLCSSFLPGFNGKRAFTTYLRDKKAHLSPNCAQTEAVAAGAMEIQLGGTHDYFGKPVEKPAIGEEIKICSAEHIRGAQRLMMGSFFISFLLFGGVYFLLS
ncbi:cobalamin biosynthesis protein CobD [Anaerostipes sp. 992a]|uniref:adenosylcobinamide-phosphate synthase CbiB n=1 Tax=Anaerostipes sp. 992a TaxID=1261637 RepID=UPI000951BA1D|nr:adenosylcobinamide-phosphate synthase CbiB [Anaerostipes sp. 992a]OLR62655.1 cobalamin biosynthesis protein CobD [Anaerostipes sp. 992a]